MEVLKFEIPRSSEVFAFYISSLIASYANMAGQPTEQNFLSSR